jgi:thioredoxin-like negative regulator of GroEL
MYKLSSQPIFKKLLIFVGAGSFLFASVGHLSDMFANSSDTKNTQQEQLSPEEQLKQKAEGFKLVLAREPENTFVIENLLAIYLEMRDLNSALPLAEKLVSLQPNNARYEETLATIQKGLAESSPKNPAAETPSPEVNTTEEEK